MFTWKKQWRAECLPSKARVATSGVVSSARLGASGGIKPSSVSLRQPSSGLSKTEEKNIRHVFLNSVVGHASKEINF